MVAATSRRPNGRSSKAKRSQLRRGLDSVNLKWSQLGRGLDSEIFMLSNGRSSVAAPTSGRSSVAAWSQLSRGLDLVILKPSKWSQLSRSLDLINFKWSQLSRGLDLVILKPSKWSQLSRSLDLALNSVYSSCDQWSRLGLRIFHQVNGRNSIAAWT